MQEVLPKGRTRETKIRRDARGRWWNDGDLIDHDNLARSFDLWLDRAPDGRYCLNNAINWAYVEVEGPPVFVRAAHEVDGTIALTLSGGDVEPLVVTTLRQGPDGALYCDVRKGLAARFDRCAESVLAEYLDEDQDGVFVSFGGIKHYPEIADDPLSPLAPLGPKVES